MAGLNFDARQVAPSEALDPVPPGWYNVQIIESEMKATANGNGSYLSLTFQILDGAHANRKVFTNLNLNNPNAAAVEIAYKQLSAICHAVGVIQVQDSTQLHGLPMMAKISVRPAKDGYDASNEIKGFKKNEGGGAPVVGGAGPGAGAAPAWAGTAPIPAANPPPPPMQPQGGWAAPTAPPPQVAQPQQVAPPMGNGAPPIQTAPPVGGASAVPPWARPPGT
jgi:hypothetical protein